MFFVNTMVHDAIFVDIAGIALPKCPNRARLRDLGGHSLRAAGALFRGVR